MPVDDEASISEPGIDTNQTPIADPSLIQDESDGGPTRHIALPDRVLLARLDSAEEALLSAQPERTQKAPVPAEPTEFLAKKPQIVRQDLDLETRPPSVIDRKLAQNESKPAQQARSPSRRAADPEPLSGPRRVAPKPGVIRRHSRAHARTEARPRAAMHHVRSLYGVLMPFMEELVPLSYERRSRRFWARWREVAGDRGGVRRSFVEELLQTAEDARTLACELISEIQTVDLESVYALVDRLEAEPASAKDKS